MSDNITQLLHGAADGDAAARERLFNLVYRDLTRLAKSHLSRERTYTHLDAPSLVHEAYLRFAEQIPPNVANRRVFYAYASRAMHSVILDYVRARDAKKRGDGVPDVTLVTGLADECYEDDSIEVLHSALERLERIDRDLHEIVQLRYFAGLSIEQVAEMMDSSPATVKRQWSQARTILKHEMGEAGD